MGVERTSAHGCFVEVLDRVLDKGLVIDAEVRVSIAGIELIGVEARVVVASIPTYLKFSAAVAETPTAARPGSPAPRLRAAVLTPRPSGRRCRPTRRIRTIAVRCEHGCTFPPKRGSTPSTVACPFDGTRVCALTRASAVGPGADA